MNHTEYLVHKYCVGEGIEIGKANYNDYGVIAKNVDMECPDHDAILVEHKNYGIEPPKIDIEADAHEIPLPDESQDFIFHSHVFEHMKNPVKALKEWMRILKPGGHLVMIIPHKERTFDSNRERSTVQHILEDFYDRDGCDGAPEHYHVYITQDVVDLIEELKFNHDFKWGIVDVEDVDEKVGNGFTIVIRKDTVCK